MILYFTGTGNSRYVAQKLAAHSQDTLCMLNRYLREGAPATLHSKQPWVFVLPTYAWRMPRVVERLLQQIEFLGSRQAYFLLTCGSETGDAALFLRKLCQKKGWVFRGLTSIVMPENYIAMFAVPDAARAAQIVAAAEPAIQAAAKYIEKEEPLPAEKRTFFGWLASSVGNFFFYLLFVKADKFYATDACTSCGQCARLCPLRNIHLEDGRPLWDRQCTHCMACICACPVQAIEYGRASFSKPRYYLPAEAEREESRA